jgi:hypothetical protein
VIYFNHYRVDPYWSTIFFISLLICGQYILLNLFMAILLNEFEVDSINGNKEEQTDKQLQSLEIKSHAYKKKKKDKIFVEIYKRTANAF